MRTNRPNRKIFACLLAVLLTVLLAQGIVCGALAAALPTNEMDGSKIERIDIFWVTPDSVKANNGTATPGEITADDQFLFLATDGADDLEMKYQFEIEFSGQHDYNPGDIKISVPAQVWHTRTYDADGKGIVNGQELMGSVRLPIPQAPKATADFNWQKVGDSYVFTNTKTIGATSRATFQVTICALAPEAVVDMSLCDPISVKCEVVTNQGNTIELTSPEIRAQVDTIAKITGSEKGGQIYFKQVPADLPAGIAANLPAGTDKDDYYYVRWYTYFFHQANQPFSVKLDDIADTVFEYVLDEDGNYVEDADGNRQMTKLDVDTIFLGCSTHEGQILPTTADGEIDFTAAVETNTYLESNVKPYRDSVVLWTAYPKEQFPPLPETWELERYFWFPNTARWTLTETDADPEAPEGFAAAADGQLVTGHEDIALERLRQDALRPVTPPGWEGAPSDFWFNKWTEEYHKDYDYGYGLNQLLIDQEAEMRFHLRTEGHGYGMTKEPGAEDIPENYGKLGWRQTTEDYDTFWEESAVPLTSEDFRIAYMDIPDPKGYVYGLWKKWNEEIQDYEYFYAYAIDANRPIPDLVVEYRVDGSDEWVKAGVARWGSNGTTENTGFSFEETTDGVTFDNAAQRVYFPDTTVDVRHTYVSNVFKGTTMTEWNPTGGWRWDVYLGINLKPSDRVKAIADFLVKNVDVIDSEFRNDAKCISEGYVRANPDGTPGEGSSAGTIYDYSIASIKAAKYGVNLSKEVEFDPGTAEDPGDRDVDKRMVTLHYTAKLNEASNLDNYDDYYAAVEEGIINKETAGIYYDLLPEGVVPVLDSITVSAGETVTNKYIIDNYKDTGRVLMVVELEMTPTLTRESSGRYGTNSYKQWIEDNSWIRFDARVPFDIIGTDGVNLTNYIAFETKVDQLYRDTLGSITGQKGDADDPRGGNNYNTPAMPDAIADAMTGLDSGDLPGESRFVYASVSVNLNTEVNMLTGYRKDVRDPLVGGTWTQGLLDMEQVTVYEGHPYIYRLWVDSASNTDTSNIIMFDTIENYIIPDPAGSDATKAFYYNDVESKKNWQGDWEGKGQWRGRLVSVDMGNFVEMGAAPVLYISTVPGLQFGDTDTPAGSDETIAFFNSGAYNIDDVSIWQKVEMDENGFWAVPEDLLGQVSAVAVDMRKKADGTDFVLLHGTQCEGYLNMVAPDDDMDPDCWNAKGAFAHVPDADGNPTQEVDWEKASASPENNMYAYNNTRLKCVQTAADNPDAQGAFAMIRNDFVRVGILPRIIYLEKQWDDDDNYDNIRPESVTFTVQRRVAGQAAFEDLLDASGNPVTLTLSEANQWKEKLLQPDIVNEENLPYQYRFVEEVPEGYAFSLVQEDEAHFTATNKHQPLTTEISGEKVWNDNGNEAGVRPESITVKLLRNGEVIKTNVVKPDDNGDWKYSFGELRVNARGGEPYVYTVEEEYVPKYIASCEGYSLIENDLWPYGDLSVEKKLLGATEISARTEFTFTLTVLGETTAEMEENGEEASVVLEDFDYEIFEADASGQWQTTGITGKKNGSCTFTLKGNQKIVFYGLPSESTYTVTEQKIPGFRLTTKVGDTGIIRAARTSEAVFTNTYSASGETQLVAGKGQQGAGMKNNQHRFEIIDMNDGSETYGQSIRTAYSGTAQSGQEEIGQAITSEAVANFGALTYTAADHGKTFTYKVVEVDMQKPGFTYDDTAYTVTVTVTDNGDGTMTVTAVDGDGNDATTATGETLPFENEYEATGEISLKAWKTLLRRPLAADEFSFEVYKYDPATETPIGTALQTKKNDADGNILFDPIAFDQDDVSVDPSNPAKYYFLVKEKAGTDATVIYSAEKYIYEVTVYDNGNGTLSFDQLIHAETADGAVAAPLFTNDVKDGGLAVEKKVNGDADSTQEFTFKVKLSGEGLPDYLDGALSGTPAPSPTPGPEPTPEPTATPAPTATPEPTATPLPLPDAFVGQYSTPYHATLAELAGEAYAVVDLREGSPTYGTMTFFRSTDETDLEGNPMNFGGSDVVRSWNADADLYYCRVKEVGNGSASRPWVTAAGSFDPSLVTGVTMRDPIRPDTLDSFFIDMKNVTSFDLSKLDTSLAKYAGEMFSECRSVAELDLSGFDTGLITYMEEMFINCANLVRLDVSNFDTSSVKFMARMFDGCHVLEALDVSGWDTGSAVEMTSMFYDCRALRYVPVENWDTSGVTTMNGMFLGAAVETLDLNGWDTSGVTNMGAMFNGCKNLVTLDLSGWDTSRVESFSSTFSGCQKLKEVIAPNLITSACTSMFAMFNECMLLERIDSSNWDMVNVESMAQCFDNCRNLKEMDSSGWVASSLTSLQYTFENCYDLEELNVSNFDVSNVNNFYGCFKDCRKVKKLDISNWDIGHQTSFRFVFNTCTSLEELDVSNLDVSNLVWIDGTFANCGTPDLVLDVSGWHLDNIRDMSYLFSLSDAKVVGINNLMATVDPALLSEAGLHNSFYHLKQDELDIRSLDFVAHPELAELIYQYDTFTTADIPKVVIGDHLLATSAEDFPKAKTGSPYGGMWENEATGELLTDTKLFTEGDHGDTWIWFRPRYSATLTPGTGTGPIQVLPDLSVRESFTYDCGSFVKPGYKLVAMKDQFGTSHQVSGGKLTIPADTYAHGDEIVLTAQWEQRPTGFDLTNGEFTFSIYAGETITFEGLPAYTAYQVMEQTPKGWKIVAQENVSGIIKPVQIAKAVFTNEKGESDQAQAFPVVQKLLDGKPAAAGLFTFTLEDPDGNIVETVTNGDGGFVPFQPITFTTEDLGGNSSKNFSYKIREINKTDPCIGYDSLNYMEVRVTLSKSGGRLQTGLKYYRDGTSSTNDPVFKNLTKPGNLKFSKEIAGTLTDAAEEKLFNFEVSFKNPDQTPWTGDSWGEVKQYKNNSTSYLWANVSTGTVKVQLRGGECVEYRDIPAGVTYEIKETGSLPGWQMDGTVHTGKIAAAQTNEHSYLNTYSAKGVANISLSKFMYGRDPEDGEFTFQLCEGNTVIATATNDGLGNISFPALTYTQPGTYHYIVVEVPGDDPDVFYSNQRIDVTVTVSDEEANGNLTAKVQYTGGDAFYNYSMPGSISVIKQVESAHEQHKSPEFYYPVYLFLLNPDGSPYYGYVYMDEAMTVPMAFYGYVQMPCVHNVPISLYGIPAGTGYAVMEMDLSGYGFTTVYEGEVGTIESNTMAVAKVINAYSAKGEHQLHAAKQLLGATLGADQFTFQLYRVNADGTETLVDTVTNDAGGNVDFSKLTFTAGDAGTYVYRIRELNDGQPGIEYDASIKEITLTVTDDLYGSITVTEETADGQVPVFINEYREETSVTATKQWVGDEDHPETRMDILVNLYKKLPGQEARLVDTRTIPADAEGDALTVTWDQLPKFEEADGGKVEITYYVTEEMQVPEGETPAYEGKVTGSAKNGFLLVNRYAAASVQIEAVKELDGRQLASGQFTFLITDEAGNQVATATNDAEGTVLFPPFEYTMADILDTPMGSDGSRVRYINLMLLEANDQQPGYTYDDSFQNFTITLTLDGNGELSAQCNLLPREMVFHNTYESNGVWMPAVRKTVNGETPREHEVFTFRLLDGEGNVLQTVQNTGREANFETITYDMADVGKTFDYTIVEVEEERPGYTFDTTRYNVEVTVADNGDGTLSATPVYTRVTDEGAEVVGNLLFDNRYEAYGELVLTAEKTVNNKTPLAHHVYTFQLKDEEGNVLKEAENRLGDIAFEKLTYTEADMGKTYRYTVSEVNEDTGFVTCDPTVYTVTVAVSDNMDGTLDVQKTLSIAGAEAGAAAPGSITFNNLHDNRLSITKQVEGADSGEEFTFTISLFGTTGTESQQAFSWTRTDAAGVAVATGMVDSGSAFRLRGGETLCISGLPEEFTYRVTEDDPIGYMVTVNGETGFTTEGTVEMGMNEVTFVNTLKTTQVAVTKQWVDEDNAAGLRPESIEVTLLANGEEAGTATLTADAQGNWAHTFTDLPMYAEGEEIAYTVTERPVEGYLPVQIEGNAAEGYTLINEQQTRLTVSKTVEGGDAARAFTFTFTLTDKDGNNVTGTYPFTITNAAGETVKTGSIADGDTFTLCGGEQIVITGLVTGWKYRVEETAAVEYSVTVNGEAGAAAEAMLKMNGNEVAFINTFKTTQVAVTKQWVDEDNAAGLRPESIEVTLLANGGEAGTATLTADAQGNWAHTFTDLPMYADGEEIAYTVTEKPVEGYLPVQIEGNAAEGYTLINEQQTRLTVSKTVEGGDAARAFTFTFALTDKDGNNVTGTYPFTITNAAGETVRTGSIAGGDTFTLCGGEQIVITGLVIGWKYRVEETAAVEYTVTVNGEAGAAAEAMLKMNGNEVAFVNTFKTTQVAVTKQWVDEDNAAGLRPESIEVTLLANGGEAGTATLTADAQGNWAHTFTDLPMYAEGEEIAYTVTEKPVEGYLPVQIEGNAAEGYTLINEQQTRLTVSKTVEGGDAARAFTFTFALTDKDGNNVTGTYPFTITNAAGETVRTGSIADGDTFTLCGGEQIVITGLVTGWKYRVEETAAVEYTVTVNGEAGTAAEALLKMNGNEVTFVNTLKTVRFAVTKQWIGGSGPIELTLYAGKVALQPQPVCIRSGDTYIYENLPKYDSMGTEIVYAAKEKYFDGFVTIYDNVEPHATETSMIYNGGTIINRPAKVLSFKIKKVWNGITEGTQPPPITLTLYCNGEVMNIGTPSPSESGWYRYYDLPEEVDGVPAVYTVKEQPVDGFTTTYLDEDGNTVDHGVYGGTILNSRLPSTGDSTPLGLLVSLMGLAIVGIALLMTRRRKA